MPARQFYENFDVVFIPDGGENKYKATVLNALGGDASVQFSLAQAPEEVVEGIARHFNLGTTSPAPPAPATTPASLPADEEKVDVGEFLFETLFHGDMLRAFTSTRERAPNRGAFLRLRLNFTETPELAGVPWEMLRNGPNNMGFNQDVSVVRYQNVSFPRDEDEVSVKPIRMLVVVSSPRGVPPLQVEKELQRINTALKPYIDAALIKVERLERATLSQLDDRLFDRDNSLHILHFIGHGRFDTQTKVGQLLFEADNETGALDAATPGDPEPVSGKRLAQSLSNHPSLRMAMLNACEGAMVSSTDSYAGVAQQLVETGTVPVVVAMRKVISDELAIAFAQTFYEWSLVKKKSVDLAMTRARLKMRDVEAKQNGTEKTASEWATPMLFIRNHSGYLVNFGDQVVIPKDLSGEADPAMETHYKTILNVLTKGKLVPFLGLDINLIGREPIDKWEPKASVPPSYRELVEYLVTSSKHPFPFVPALADVSQYALLKSDDEGSFYEDLIGIFAKADKPTSLHKFWAAVAANNAKLTGASSSDSSLDDNRRFLIVCSTYDNLLEKAFKQALDRFHVVSYVAHGDYQGKFRHTPYAKTGDETVAQPTVTVESANAYANLFDQAPVILKIPGTVGETGGPRFAITEDQYLDFLAKRELANILPKQLLVKLRNSNHLFLGFNVREWSLRALLYRIWEGHQPPFACYAVIDPPPQMQEGDVDPADVIRKYWNACGVKIVERDLGQYMDGLKRSCENVLPNVQF